MMEKEESPPDPSPDREVENSIISSVPEEMIADILVKLPLRSLLRFKLLSKRICDLINSPYFVDAHADQHRANSSGLFVLTHSSTRYVASLLPTGEKFDTKNISDRYDPIRSFSLPFLDGNYDALELECAGSCNGLVCLVVDRERMVLWNPATSDYGVAPLRRKMRSGIRSRDAFGFGQDPVTGDYKSVRISVWNDGTIMSEVLSWGKRTWTELEDFDGILQDTINHNVYRIVDYHLSRAVTTAGRVTWIMASDQSTFRGQDIMLSFRLDTERFESGVRNGCDSGRVEEDVCVWRGSIDGHMRKTTGFSQPLFWLSLVNNDGGSSGNWSKMFAVAEYWYIHKWAPLPTAIWSGGGDRKCPVLKHWNGAARDPKGNTCQLQFDEVITAFEFAETLVPIPNSS